MSESVPPNTSSPPDRQDLLQTAVKAAHAAGAVHRHYQHQPLQVRHKDHLSDLVTQADVQAEVAIRQAIHATFPQHEVLGEETAWPASKQARLHELSCWIVDPLDGTQNYASGLPLSCVSIAYIHQGTPLIGVVYDPAHHELFTASQGQGAWLNDAPIQVSTRASLDTPALLGTGFPRDISLRPELLRPFLNLTERGLPVRRLGCAALSLAFLAAGRTDGYWDAKLAPWDVAAGLLLIQEAGGQITDMRGQPYQWGGSLTASNRLIHGELLAVTRLGFQVGAQGIKVRLPITDLNGT